MSEINAALDILILVWLFLLTIYIILFFDPDYSFTKECEIEDRTMTRTNQELTTEIDLIVDLLKTIESTIITMNLRISYLELKQKEIEQ